MATRIYTLAKELKLDNKVLVDICNRIGITGKGSALASLSDEEVAAIKSHLGGSGKKGGPGGAVAVLEGPMARAVAGRGLASSPLARCDDHVVPSPVSKKVPVLEKRPEKPAAKKPAALGDAPAAAPPPEAPPVLVEPAADVVEAGMAPAAGELSAAGPPPVDMSLSPTAPALAEAAPPAEEPAMLASAAAPPVLLAAAAAPSAESVPPAPEELIEPPSGPAPAAPAEGQTSQPLPPGTKLERPIRPLRPVRPDRPIDRLDRPAKPRSDRPRPERTGPSIKLAPLPQVQQPTPVKPAEPTPQKPDMKLPDAIRASKAGGKPLSEHLRKQEEKRKAGGKKPVGKTPAAPNPAEVVDLLAKKEEKDRARKGVPGTAVAADEETAATLGGREQRQLKRKRSATAKRRHGDEEESSPARESRRLRRTGTSSTAAPRKNKVVLDLPCTVRAFAETLGLPVPLVLGKLLELGLMSRSRPRSPSRRPSCSRKRWAWRPISARIGTWKRS